MVGADKGSSKKKMPLPSADVRVSHILLKRSFEPQETRREEGRARRGRSELNIDEKTVTPAHMH